MTKWKIIFKILCNLMHFAIAVVIGCFFIYLYYQVRFLQQLSWVSDEAFNLQALYLKWLLGSAVSVAVAWILNGAAWLALDKWKRQK